MNSHLNKLTTEGKSVLQDWVGDFDLEKIVLYVHDGRFETIVVTLHGGGIHIYRLFTAFGQWNISVDHSEIIDPNRLLS